MTHQQKLVEMMENVNEGKFPDDISPIGTSHMAQIHFFKSFNGSLDAVKALHDFSQNSRTMGWTMVLVSNDGVFATSPSHLWFCDDPARAWLMAILNALLLDGHLT